MIGWLSLPPLPPPPPGAWPPLEVCILGWAGGVPFWPIFMEKTPKNEVFRQWLRMGRVALGRLI